MGKEIERKFLLTKGASIPIPMTYKKYTIKQGYILSDQSKQVRIRLTVYDAVIGLKFGNGNIRDEYEYEIPMSDGEEMYEKCDLKLEKHRLSFNKGHEHYDVDEFPNGLIFVEVEFKTVKDMENWVKPHWIGKEITGKKKYSNITLAKQKLKW